MFACAFYFHLTFHLYDTLSSTFKYFCCVCLWKCFATWFEKFKSQFALYIFHFHSFSCPLHVFFLLLFLACTKAWKFRVTFWVTPYFPGIFRINCVYKGCVFTDVSSRGNCSAQESDCFSVKYWHHSQERAAKWWSSPCHNIKELFSQR